MRDLKDDHTRLEIRRIKYNNYIKKKPDKPFGYYCLGMLEITKGNLKESESSFKKAISVDRTYVRAITGHMEVLIRQGKFIKAAKLYSINKAAFSTRKMYKSFVCRAVTSIYKEGLIKKLSSGFISSFKMNFAMKSIEKIVNEEPNNPVANLLLAMHCLNSQQKSSKQIELIKYSAYLSGISDEFRWDLVNFISKKDHNILKDGRIAKKFYRIPEDNYNTDYSNFVFSVFLKLGKTTKILESYEFFKKNNVDISPTNLWNYAVFCDNNELYNMDLANCVNILLNVGWVDSKIASIFNKLIEKGLAKWLGNSSRILRLYGYSA